MAYKTEELEKQALEAITKHNLFFIEDIVAYLPCTKPTFYEHNLNESNAIKTALETNKINQKVKLRKKWADADAPALQIALYKLIATEDENGRINSQKNEVEHSFTDKTLKIGYGDRGVE